MSINLFSERQLQNNVIDLLKSMGYTFISQEENVNFRNGKLSDVLLKDVLVNQLQKLNSFEYKGITYPFSPKNIANAVQSLDESLNEGLSLANATITDQLILGNSYQEELHDGVKKSFSLKYIDFKNIENNIFHFTEEYSEREREGKIQKRKKETVKTCYRPSEEEGATTPDDVTTRTTIRTNTPKNLEDEGFTVWTTVRTSNAEYRVRWSYD